MAHKSRIEPIVSLSWVFERPDVGESRQSSIFSFLQNQCYFKISLSTFRSREDQFCCTIQLVPDLPRGIGVDLHINCQLKTSKETYYQSVRSTHINDWSKIFSQILRKDAFYPFKRVEEWTVLCVFNVVGSTESFSLEVGNKRVKMSIGNNSPSVRKSDECIQVPQEVPRGMEALSSDISSLLEDTILPDFELKCGGRVFPVHRSVLAARSEVFRAMLQNRMAESESGSADIKDVEPRVLESLLKFLYSGKFADPTDDDIVSGLYEASDKYAVRSLSAACSYWMVRNMNEDNCLDCLKNADSHSDLELRRAAVAYLRDNPGIFKSEAWSAFSKEHMSLAYEVLHTYVTT